MSILHNLDFSEDVSLITIVDAPVDLCFLASVFDMLSESKVNVDMISQSPPQGPTSSLSFSVSGNDLEHTLNVISQLRAIHPTIRSSVSNGNSKLIISSNEMKYTPGVAASVFNAIAKARIDVSLITTSETEIALLIRAPYLSDAINSITAELS